MANNQKLELTWLGKDTKVKIEPRILIEDKDKSNCINVLLGLKHEEYPTVFLTKKR